MKINFSYYFNIVKKGFYIFFLLFFGLLIYSVFFMSMCACGDDPKTQARSRDAARKAHLNQLTAALNLYLQENEKLPNYKNFTWVDKLKTYLIPKDLKVIPQDPKANQKYYYKNVNDTWFVLAAEMETTKYSCNLIASNLDEVNQRLSDKSISEIQALLSSYDKKNDKKCFYVLAN